MLKIIKSGRSQGKKLAIAIEKSEGKRPKAMVNGRHGCCPTCGSLVHKYEELRVVNACKWCGQALDWRTK